MRSQTVFGGVLTEKKNKDENKNENKNEKEMHIRKYLPTDQEDVVKLWHQCGLIVPWNDPGKDIQRKIAFQPQWFFVGVVQSEVVATVMAGYDGHRGWINYLAVAPHCQKQGYGRKIMKKAEEVLREAGCPKINLQVRKNNLSVIRFYYSLGYKDDEVVSLGKRLD